MKVVQERIALNDGEAADMGEGVFVVMQKDEKGAAQSVVLTKGDLEQLLAA